MTKKLGPYRLEKLLGRGGMGSVFAGVHEETGQRAAVKSLSLGLGDDPNFRSRFLVEIETLKQLRHPNIVQILGDGEQDGQLFYAMELVEGQTLQDLLQSGYQFSWQEVVRIAVEVCGALKHAHDCGVIHRDLKPANLLRTPEGSVKLTDFGIAKLFGATHQTAAGSVVGTADYMSPEQSDGRTVSHRTDLYSLGAVMFTLLARRSPFQGGTLAQIVHKLKYDEAPSVRRFAPEVPEELGHVIAELLRKDPAQRPATALALANRLRAMEHVLNARAVEPPTVDSAATRVSEPGDGDSPTAMVLPDDDATKVGRTLSEQDGDAVLGNFSWNDATVETAPAKPSTAKPSAAKPSTAKPSTARPPTEKRGATSAAKPAAGSVAEPRVSAPPAEAPVPVNRFTTVDEDLRRRSSQRSWEESDSSGSWLTTTSIAVALAGIAGLFVWGFWPPSADTLYRRIHWITAEQGPDYAWKEIGQFLARFPEDPRYAEIEGMRMDVECDWLESRLRRRKLRTDGQGVESYEREWLDAYLVRHKDPALAKDKLQSIVERYGQDPNPTASLKTVLAAAQHQLKRLAAPEREP